MVLAEENCVFTNKLLTVAEFPAYPITDDIVMAPALMVDAGRVAPSTAVVP